MKCQQKGEFDPPRRSNWIMPVVVGFGLRPCRGKFGDAAQVRDRVPRRAIEAADRDDESIFDS